MKHALALLLVCLFAVSIASAQQAQTIRGSEHPELISNSQAYGLFFAHFSNRLADPKLTDIQNARMFNVIGLSAKDEAALRDVLNDHKFRRDAQLAAFNKRATEAYLNGESVPSFTQTHQSVIRETQSKLTAALSADGLGKLDQFIQRAKSHMVVPAIQ